VATGNPIWDAVGTIGIGVLLIVVAVFVAVEIKAMLIGQSMDPLRERELRDYLAARPEIARVLNVITVQLGNDAMVSVQAQMHEAGDAIAMVQAINAVERGMKATFPEVRWSFFEPDLEGEGRE
jgi:divalent metal cation (Fe/Co/Zn/Cd) transporter